MAFSRQTGNYKDINVFIDSLKLNQLINRDSNSCSMHYGRLRLRSSIQMRLHSSQTQPCMLCVWVCTALSSSLIIFCQKKLDTHLFWLGNLTRTALKYINIYSILLLCRLYFLHYNIFFFIPALAFFWNHKTSWWWSRKSHGSILSGALQDDVCLLSN